MTDIVAIQWFDTIDTMVFRLLRIHPHFTVIGVILLSTFIAWIPFLFGFDSWYGIDFSNASFLTVYQHYDGLLYIVPAKTLYNNSLYESLKLEQGLTWNYYAAHLPLYPIFIAGFAVLVGHLKAMLLVTILFTVFLASILYETVKAFQLSKKPLLLTVLFLFLPRLFVIRSVGAPEPMFMFFIFASVYFFETKKYALAGLLGALATMTKTPGILLCFAYGLVFFEEYLHSRKVNWNWGWITLIPFGLIAVFSLYAVEYGDFFAYFNSGDNIHLVRPFAVFNAQKVWVGTAWLEDIIFYFFLYGLTIFTFRESKYRSFFYFPLVFLGATLFVEHRDIARYTLPLWPFAVIAFQKFFTSKRFLLLSLILLPAIYLYAWNFMLQNILPVSDWSAFL